MQTELVGDCPRELLKAAEDLFYVVYAHLKAEISNIKLRQSFHFGMKNYIGGRPQPIDGPEPNHLKHILQACLALLSSDEISTPLDKLLIRQEQADYAEKAMKTVSVPGNGRGNVPTLQHIEKMVREPRSHFNDGFRALGLPSDAPPAMILGTLTEKYRGHLRRVAGRSNNRIYEESRRRRANHDASYAKLIGVTVGKYRRDDGKLSQHEYLREKFCICFGSCHCAKGCTAQGDRVCPCNARLCLKSGFKDVDLHGSFDSMMSDGAARIIELLKKARRTASTTELVLMLAEELISFPDEVILFRRLVSQLSKPNTVRPPKYVAAGRRPPSKSRCYYQYQVQPRETESPAVLCVAGPGSSISIEPRTGNRRPGAAWVAFLNAKMEPRSAG